MNGIEIVARNPIFFKITTAFENILKATMDTAIFGTHLSFLIVDSQKFEHSCRLGRRFDSHYGQGWTLGKMSGYVELYILLSKTKFLFYLPQAKSEQKTINPNDTKVFIFFSHDNKRSKVDVYEITWSVTRALRDKQITKNRGGGKSALVQNLLSRFC